MGAKTSIEWTDRTWSPLRVRVRPDAAEIAIAKGYQSLVQIGFDNAGHPGHHCEPVSAGCANCYSEAWQARCLKVNGTGLPFDRRSRDLVEPFVDEKVLREPLSWRKPQRVFVENQSDLFGDWFTDEMLDRVFAVMALCPQHTFQVLTKRPERMREYLSAARQRLTEIHEKNKTVIRGAPVKLNHAFRLVRAVSFDESRKDLTWPLPNVWLGVSVEDQKTADERISILLRTPAAKRFVSYEPALGPVDFEKWTDSGLECNCDWSGVESECREGGPEDDPGYLCPVCGEICAHLPLDERLDWVIVGGESGPGARPPEAAWFRSVRNQCGSAGVPFFFKQFGAWLPAMCDGAVIEGQPQELNSSDAPIRVGKKKAGALLDGREWREFPK